MPFLTTADGRTLAWEERGDGPPLLLHPGGPGFAAAPFADQPERAAERPSWSSINAALAPPILQAIPRATT